MAKYNIEGKSVIVGKTFVAVTHTAPNRQKLIVQIYEGLISTLYVTVFMTPKSYNLFKRLRDKLNMESPEKVVYHRDLKRCGSGYRDENFEKDLKNADLFKDSNVSEKLATVIEEARQLAIKGVERRNKDLEEEKKLTQQSIDLHISDFIDR